MADLRRSCSVDVLIRGSGNVELTRACIGSIQQNTEGVPYQIVYVDNGSDPGEMADLLKSFPDITIVRLPFNHGSVRGINVGLQLSQLSDAKFVLLMDNDTAVPAGDKQWLARFMEHFADPKVGAVGAVSDYTSGHQNCEALPDFYQKDWTEESTGRKGYKLQPDWPLLVSFGMMIRKEALDGIGWLFDEQFDPGNFEETDACIRLRDNGWTLKIATSVWLHHRGSQTFRGMGYGNLLAVNSERFRKKWGNEKLQAMGVRAPAIT